MEIERGSRGDQDFKMMIKLYVSTFETEQKE